MLILLRHGQTTSNVDRKLDTLLPGAPLTPSARSRLWLRAERFQLTTR